MYIGYFQKIYIKRYLNAHFIYEIMFTPIVLGMYICTTILGNNFGGENPQILIT